MACGQAIGVAVGITVWQMRPMFTVGLQIDDHRRNGTAFDQATTGGIRQHRHRAAIGLHIGQPLRRISRIQRHIRTARLQHRHHRHHHLHTALHADRHAIVRAHTQSAQVMCQPIGSRIQLRIRQRHLTLHHRDGRGITRDLRLEQLMHTGIARIIRCRCIPLHQYLMPLGLRQDVKISHRRLRRMGKRIGQLFQRLHQECAYPLRSQWPLRLHRQRKTRPHIVHRNEKRIIRPLMR